MSFDLVLIYLSYYIKVKNAKFLIVTINVQNAIQKTIVQNFLLENILENVFVMKTITIIWKIAFAKNAQNFGKIISY